MQPSWIPAATPVSARDDFQQVTVGILEIDTASAIVAIDFTNLLLYRVSPIGQRPLAKPTEDFVKLRFAD